jgi:hypothetical protein
MAGDHAPRFLVRITMETLFDWLFPVAWAWFLEKIGMSPEEKLARAEVTNTDLKAEIKTEKEAIGLRRYIGSLAHSFWAGSKFSGTL